MTLYKIRLRCPACGHEWHAATIETESWWGKGVDPRVVASRCYCVTCGEKPPMVVANDETQGALFL